MEIWREHNKGMEIWRYGDMEISQQGHTFHWRYVDIFISPCPTLAWRYSPTLAWRYGDNTTRAYI